MLKGAPPELTAPEAFQLGLQHQRAGQMEQAEAAYRNAIVLDPGHAEAHNNLGNALHALGRTAQAIAHYRRTLELRPRSAAVLDNLGKALGVLGEAIEAEQCIRQAIECDPGYAEAHNDLGKLLQDRGALDEAADSYQTACALKPDQAAAHFNLANMLFSFGRLEEAEQGYRRAVALDPGHAASQSNLAFMLNYLPGASAADIFAEHLRFARRFCATAPLPPHGDARVASRRLRLGYVSGDLRNHAVAFFIEPVLASHDHDQFEVFCYYSYPESDAVTARLKRHADHWRDVFALDDEALAASIRKDSIDILVDLSGHTIHNRLLAFSRKPAPVQVTWLGYLNTTGLEAMDYRITDAQATPRGVLDTLHTERLVRLPDTQWCYRPPEPCPGLSPPPSVRAGTVTFASLANLSKISNRMLELWGQLLGVLPRSRLVIASAILDRIPAEYAARCARHGIDRTRLELKGKAPLSEYLELHSMADVMLDTHPYSSGATACHSLWMGVPIVTLAGETATSRSATTLLNAVGLNDLVSSSPGQYLDIAAGLATDAERLAALRMGMRERMRASALMDELRFTRNLENSYREMWRALCQNRR